MAGMSPSLRRALAYAHITGRLPRHLHARTYCDAMDRLEGETLKRTCKPEVFEEVRTDPLFRAHEFMIARGFKVEHRQGGSLRGNTSHYVSYRLDGDFPPPIDCYEGGASRDGSAWIVPVRTERPYRVTESFSREEVCAALAGSPVGHNRGPV